MDLVVLQQHWSAILCIFIIIGMMIFTIIKKWMITYGLLLTNIAVFIITIIFFREVVTGVNIGGKIYLAGLGFRPIYLVSELFPQIYTLLTSMFIHSGFAHILGNMIALFFVGIALEQRIGWKKFIFIYIISGIIGALVHSASVLLTSSSDYLIPLVGASGAIFGVMGALLYSYPRDEIVMPVPVGFFMIIRRIKVIYAVLIFSLIETIAVFLSTTDNTAHLAHLGGILGGFFLAAIVIGRKRDQKFYPSEEIYYDSFYERKVDEINLSGLKSLAKNAELKEILKKIENENIPHVRDLWIEYFVEKASCPNCKGKLFRMENRIICESCGFNIGI